MKYEARSINKSQTVALVAWHGYGMSLFKNWDELREKFLRSIKLLARFGDSSRQENKEAETSLGRGERRDGPPLVTPSMG